MKSHTCEFSVMDLVWLLGLPVVPVLIFTASMRLSLACHLLPAPRPAFDVDRTILVHQAEASRSKQASDLLLIGDSSCLMDVSARQLAERLGRGALNLDLNAYRSMLQQYTNANPGRLRAVVLLMHPEALRRISPESYQVEFLKSFFEGVDYSPATGIWERLAALLGLEAFRGRLLVRVVPRPLHGAYGRFYGFTDGLERYMTEHDGSALDPEAHAFKGNAEYRLARQLEPASRAFKSAVPADAKLFVGITPVPEQFAGPDYIHLREQMLREWSQWLQAEALDLPATLPDDLFNKTTHLNEAGSKRYTEILGRALAPGLP